MRELTIPVPEETLAALQLTPAAMSAELRIAAAMKLYELRRLSSGAAAQLAGLSRTEFLQRMGQYGVLTFDLTEEELRQEVENEDAVLDRKSTRLNSSH